MIVLLCWNKTKVHVRPQIVVTGQSLVGPRLQLAGDVPDVPLCTGYTQLALKITGVRCRRLNRSTLIGRVRPGSSHKAATKSSHSAHFQVLPRRCSSCWRRRAGSYRITKVQTVILAVGVGVCCKVVLTKALLLGCL